jgi:hypothetical protein
MLTMRPKRRAIMPSITALMSMIGATILFSTARCQSSSLHWRKSPGGGPAALVTRMSGSGAAASSALRPAGVVTSAARGTTSVPVTARISCAVACSTAGSRALSTTRPPSRASAIAQPLPSPLLAPQTIAVRPLMPRSMLASDAGCAFMASRHRDIKASGNPCRDRGPNIHGSHGDKLRQGGIGRWASASLT